MVLVPKPRCGDCGASRETTPIQDPLRSGLGFRSAGLILMICLAAVLDAHADSLIYFHCGQLLPRDTNAPARGLYHFDTQTGSSRFLTPVGPGPARAPWFYGFAGFTTNSSLYALDENTGTLCTVSLKTGDFVRIGGARGSNLIYSDIALHPIDGSLVGLVFESSSGRRMFCRIDPASGAERDVWVLPFSGTGSTGLAYLADGRLFLYEAIPSSPSEGRLYEVLETERRVRRVGTVQGINTLMDLTGVGDTLYASSFGYQTNFLWRIDTATATPTPLPAPATGKGYGGLVGVRSPEVGLEVLVRPRFAGLIPGLRYQLQVSEDLSTWVNHGAPFEAPVGDAVSQDVWVVEASPRRYFRLLLLP